jgi:hypothetical protein
VNAVSKLRERFRINEVDRGWSLVVWLSSGFELNWELHVVGVLKLTIGFVLVEAGMAEFVE